MRITPIGVGDAFDPDQANSSSLVEHDGYTLLIDCGHSAVSPLWRARPDPDAVDAIFLTHLHADHVLGLPPVLERWRWHGRRKDLLVVTTDQGRALIEQFCALLEVAPHYRISFADPQTATTLGPFGLRTAETQHAVINHALLLDAGGRRFAYSGDGRPTPAARALYADADMLMHECWEVEPDPAITFHADLETVSSITGPSRIGLYHIRGGGREVMAAAVAGDQRLFVADAGVPFTI